MLPSVSSLVYLNQVSNWYDFHSQLLRLRKGSIVKMQEGEKKKHRHVSLLLMIDSRPWRLHAVRWSLEEYTPQPEQGL